MIPWYSSESISHQGEYLNYKHMDTLFVGGFVWGMAKSSG